LTVTAGKRPALATRERVVGALNKIYDSSSGILRVAGVDAYGLRNRLRLREWERILERIEYAERLERKNQVHLVREKRKGIISFAIRNVPFCGKLSSLLGEIDDADIFEILEKFPPIGR
jgi:hypothetical protein